MPTDIALSNIGVTPIRYRENRIETNRHLFDYGKRIHIANLIFDKVVINKLLIIEIINELIHWKLNLIDQ